jgi:hypothetical protein
MKLSIKQQAMVHVLKIFGISIFSGVSVALIFNYVSLTTIAFALLITASCYMSYWLYLNKLEQLEINERLNQSEKIIRNS